MTAPTPRLRMFAGPNGSGKTSVKTGLGRPAEWFGIDINPDDLQREVQASGVLSLEPFGLTATAAEVRAAFAGSPLLGSRNLLGGIETIGCDGAVLDFRSVAFGAYHASVLSDFLRRRALDASRSFTFETVMSHPDKVRVLAEARRRGYRTYLYYIATEDPAINVQRVANRVAQGGHDVPADKITARYRRSLGLVNDALPQTSRAYFLDTSENAPWYFAEATDGTRLELKSETMPHWFEPIWQRFDAGFGA